MAVDSTEAITVVIPTRNRRRLLLRALRSALAQEGVDLRVIVVDDGGDDGTADVVDALQDDRVQIVRRTRPSGVASARNAGLELVATRWVAFLDDDDFYAPRKLRAQLDALRAAPEAGWCYVGAVFVDLRARVRLWAPAPSPRSLADQLLARNVIPGGGSGLVVDTELARAIKGYDEQVASAEDWDFYIRLALAREAVAVNLPLLAYTVQTGSMTSDIASLRAARRYIEQKFAADRASRRVSLDEMWWTMFLASAAWRGGDRKQGSVLYLRSLRDRPSLRLLLLILTQTAPRRLRELKPIASRFRMPAGWRGEVDWLIAYR